MDTSEKYIRMCSLAKEIQQKWVFQSGDFVYNPAFEKIEVLLDPGNNSINYIWLPRQDQLQEICITFFMHNLRISKFEAFSRFLEWYSGRLRYTFEHGLKNGNDFIDSGEELLLNRAMIMMHWKKWDGENWVKALDGKASGKIPAKNSNYFQAGSKKD
ncbi:hypothetical protein [Methanosarcina sp. Kolksee]|uniref:hypothetical protein n=1 Tax=Methanosarcina sp. Kolksee TaxID=1434099 RepID=UPI000A3FA754|nr:hypothetical protein [Methanosarcina sp. Kolksee]